MKKIYVIFSTLILSLVLTSCSSATQETNDSVSISLTQSNLDGVTFFDFCQNYWDENSRNMCLLGLANSNKDPMICDYIYDDELKSECVRFALRLIVDCETVTPGLQFLCVSQQAFDTLNYDLCKDLELYEDSSYDVASSALVTVPNSFAGCVSHIASEKGDINGCLLIQNHPSSQFIFESCIISVVQSTTNELYCDYLDSSEWGSFRKNRCLNAAKIGLLIQNEDVESCVEFGEGCISKLAQEINDPSLCEFEDDTLYCLLDVFFTNLDDSFHCSYDFIQDTQHQDECLEYKAILSKDTGYCESLYERELPPFSWREPEDFVNECLYQMATIFNDVEICELISDEMERMYCLSDVVIYSLQDSSLCHLFGEEYVEDCYIEMEFSSSLNYLSDSCTTQPGFSCLGITFGVSAQNTIQLEIRNVMGSPLVFENDLVTRTNLNGCSVVSTSSSIDSQKRLENQESVVISIECESQSVRETITGSIFLGLRLESATILEQDYEFMIRVSTR